MKRYLNVITILLLAGLALSSLRCHKDNGVSGGGKGGNDTLVIKPAHGGVLINLTSGTAYIKYGTLNAPSNGVYDDSAAFNPVDTISQAVFTGLTNGQYFILCYGIHSTYPQPNLESKAPLTISQTGTTAVTLDFSNY